MRILILALVVVIGVPAAIAIASDNEKGASAASSRLSVRLVQKTTLMTRRSVEVTARCPNGYTVVGTGYDAPGIDAPNRVLSSESAVTANFSSGAVGLGIQPAVTVQAICARVGN